jgi:two-component system, NarL family, nitrate/nitrite response regulator NarL
MVIGRSRDPSAGIAQESNSESHITRPRVFILSDFRILCEGLVLALAQQASIMVVGASDVPITAAAIAELGPDVLLLDIAMVGGLNMVISLRPLLPDLRIVAIAGTEVEDEIIACARAAVAGFVPRKGSTQDVVAAVHSAVRGEFVCSPRAAALLFSHVGAISDARSEFPSNTKLTRREQEIVSLVREGLSNKEIARALRIQNATVKNHIHSILGKLQVRRRAEVAAQFRRAEPIRPGVVIPVA